ncbi:ABC transporter permease [Bradyrhizobium sp. dw_78]|uniref:ABC transporter permease n=1 Tax=Bradyrhizobium sp. dw_78 TaxID=2719793 RepID=UPI001BD2A476|nr:ABC transporter permease [Bradyrhizobium sp. dw_78]
MTAACYSARRGVTFFLLAPVLLIVAVGYVLPSIALVAMSFELPFQWPESFATFTARNYQKLALDPYYLKILAYTFALGLVVATITAVAAFPVAIYLARTRGRIASLYAVLTFTPLAVGMNMLTLGWMVILGRTGFINSLLTGVGLISDPLQLLYGWGSIVIGMAHVTFTFMVLPLEAVIRQIDPALEKAARMLGAGPVRTFLSVTLPLSMQGVAAGFLIVFLQVCGAFVLPLLLGGQSSSTIPISIWEQITVSSDRPFASVLSVVLMAASIVVMMIQLRVMRGKDLV